MKNQTMQPTNANAQDRPAGHLHVPVSSRQVREKVSIETCECGAERQQVTGWTADRWLDAIERKVDAMMSRSRQKKVRFVGDETQGVCPDCGDMPCACKAKP